MLHVPYYDMIFQILAMFCCTRLTSGIWLNWSSGRGASKRPGSFLVLALHHADSWQQWQPAAAAAVVAVVAAAVVAVEGVPAC